MKNLGLSEEDDTIPARQPGAAEVLSSVCSCELAQPNVLLPSQTCSDCWPDQVVPVTACLNQLEVLCLWEPGHAWQPDAGCLAGCVGGSLASACLTP